jgi:threonine synthase
LLPELPGYTPLVHATRLGREIGMRRLYLKNETVLPTGTTKDRNAGVVLALLWECAIRRFCTSSTGNSGSAYIRELSRYPEMTMYLFSGEDFVDRVRAEGSGRLVWFGLRGGTFEEAGKTTREFAAQHGLVSEHGFFNFGKREGAKLAFFEAVEQFGGPFDWYVQAISSGLGAYGTFKGAQELKGLGIIPRLPRLLCVQQASCAPQVRAYAGHSDVIRPQDAVARPTGIAHAILSGNPGKAYTYMKRAVEQSGGDYQAVDEAEIRAARTMVEELEGIEVCFSAASALAGVIKALRLGRINADDSVMVNLTGRDVVGRDFSGLRWLDRVDGGWQPDAPDAGESPRTRTNRQPAWSREGHAIRR